MEGTQAARARLSPGVILSSPVTAADCAERLEIYHAWVTRDFTVWAATWIPLVALEVAPEAWRHRIGWPATLASPIDVAMILIVIGIGVFFAQTRRYLRRLGADCPSRTHSLLWWNVAAAWQSLRPTGRCPRCGVQIFAPST